MGYLWIEIPARRSSLRTLGTTPGSNCQIGLTYLSHCTPGCRAEDPPVTLNSHLPVPSLLSLQHNGSDAPRASWHPGTWSSLQLGSGSCAPRPGGYANFGTSLQLPTPQGGDLGDPGPPSPRARKKKTESKRELQPSLGVLPRAPRPRFLAGRGGQASRVPEHRELRLEQLPEVCATIERGPRAPPAGGGRFQDGSGPECRREGEAGAPVQPRESRAGSGPAGGAQSRAAQVGQAGRAGASRWGCGHRPAREAAGGAPILLHILCPVRSCWGGQRPARFVSGLE